MKKIFNWLAIFILRSVAKKILKGSRLSFSLDIDKTFYEFIWQT